MRSIEQVAEFHRVFGQRIAATPYIDDHVVNKLRIELAAEELKELAEALGCDFEYRVRHTHAKRDVVGVLDALTDIQYIHDGTYLALGFAHVKDAASDEVHRSNMSKLDEDGRPIYRADGKILKGPNYSPPDLKSLLEEDRNASR